MLSSINDKIREQIFKKNTVSLAIEYIMDLPNDVRDNVIFLIISDMYKINIFSKGIYELDNEMKKIFQEPLGNIKDKCIDDYEFFTEILLTAKDFYDMDFISKNIVIESLEEMGEDENITLINPYHILDKISYKVVYDLDHFKEYYLDALKKRETSINDEENITGFLTSKIFELEDSDINKYNEFISQIVNIYYKFSIYFRDKNINIHKINYKYLQCIEDNYIKDVIKIISENSEILENILKTSILFCIVKNDHIENEVNKYFELNTEDIVQKKLKLKRD